jgi:hypothetical protein
MLILSVLVLAKTRAVIFVAAANLAKIKLLTLLLLLI